MWPSGKHQTLSLPNYQTKNWQKKQLKYPKIKRYKEHLHHFSDFSAGTSGADGNVRSRDRAAAYSA